MATKIIHVNQHNVKYNNKHGNVKPVFTIKQGSKNRYAKKVIINGPSELVYQPDCPLSCGARAWISTESDIELIGEMSYRETQALGKKI